MSRHVIAYAAAALLAVMLARWGVEQMQHSAVAAIPAPIKGRLP
jgi:hypothetical protein